MATNRDVVPPTRPLPMTTTENIPPVAARAPVSGLHNFATDHHLSSRPSPEQLVDHHTSPIARPHALTTTGPHTMSTAAPGLGRGRPTRGERDRHFFSSDDSALSKQIEATHAQEMDYLDVKPVLSIIEDIMRLARPLAAETALVVPGLAAAAAAQVPPHHDHHVDASADRIPAFHTSNNYNDADIVRELAHPINKISCEIICKSAGGGESHAVTMDLLKSLSAYTWDAKAVITFAAFAINYGEFWLVEQLQTKNPLAKNIATLKDLPDTMAHAAALKQIFEAVLNLLNEVLKVIHIIIEFSELPPMYISHTSPEVTAATAHIPMAVYWIIRSLLVCASTLLNLIGSGHEYITSTSESWELSNLAHKLSVIMEHLQSQLRICREMVERKKEEDAYKIFIAIMRTAHIDNMKVLRAMIRPKEDQRPLFDGSQRTTERLEVLKLKYVLLLISDLELPPEELNVLHSLHNQHAKRHEYEVLWLPIVNPNTPLTSFQESTFLDLRNNMPWFSVDHPSLVEPVAIRYIREYWNFVHMPMLVVLDPQGKPSNLDALPMMWIWGGDAFPFTRAVEEALWEKSVWNIDLVADGIHPRIPEWIGQNKVVCLYGGENINWIRTFTRATREVAQALGVPIEMLYVGKRNPKQKVRECHDIINREKLSHIFSVDYYDFVWFFWVRLMSMWNSKKQIGATVDSDPIMKEIMDLLAYDSSEQGWAIFGRGGYEITKGNGDKVLPVLEGYKDWGNLVDHPDKFVPVLTEQLGGFHPPHHCTRLILPGQTGYIPEKVVCHECGKTMDKYVMYNCCTD